MSILYFSNIDYTFIFVFINKNLTTKMKFDFKIEILSNRSFLK